MELVMRLEILLCAVFVDRAFHFGKKCFDFVQLLWRCKGRSGSSGDWLKTGANNHQLVELIRIQQGYSSPASLPNGPPLKDFFCNHAVDCIAHWGQADAKLISYLAQYDLFAWGKLSRQQR